MLRRAATLVVAGLLLSLAGCASKKAIVHEELLTPLAAQRAWIPAPEDLAAARLARVALVAEPSGDGDVDPDVIAALEALQAIEVPDEAERQPNLVPLALDLRDATLDDPLADRAGARILARRFDLDPRLEARIERRIGDDPLALAGRREFDGWHRLWARTFNAVAEPIGSSAITGFILAPYQLANSLIHYFAGFSNSEPLSFTDRQALALREEFVARHPESGIVPDVEEKIRRDRPKLAKTLARRRLRASERALDVAQAGLALHHAEAARTILSAEPDANAALRRDAEEAVSVARRERDATRARSLAATDARPTPESLREPEYALAGALLLETRVSPEAIAAPVLAYRAATIGAAQRTHVEARLAFLGAIAEHEARREARARERLARSANRDTQDDTMVRHARALLDDEWQNPHGAFVRLRSKANRDEFAWRVAGEFVRRPRYPNLPAPVAYLIDTPTIAMTVVLAPLRALLSPFTGGTPDFRRAPALAGYRYLVRYPDGEEQRGVIDWLYAYERDEERWGRALRLADWVPDFDPEERAALVDKTTEERLALVDGAEQFGTRASLLRGVASEFPDSEGGRTAGLRARTEREDASPQFIRITRGFLLENPEVAGHDGIGLNPLLLNDDPKDGELHPEGIVLRGGRVLEIRLVADGADEDDAYAPRYVEVSQTRLQQLTSRLEEAVQRNSLIDPDYRFEADPNRDTFLERAALGLTEEPSLRSNAQSSFVYQSLRERYGAVRGRDSLLPFDLVFRGSLGDFSLGAFPRWRPPRETPDAFLYR
ncbi:MAG: hypothetical protein AAGC67_00835 [Myxococcota bacterium]